MERSLFILLNDNTSKEERFKISDLSFYLKKSEIANQSKKKVIKMKEIIKIRAEARKVKIEKTDKVESWFFEIKTKLINS